jgi:hypothetical protein
MTPDFQLTLASDHHRRLLDEAAHERLVGLAAPRRPRRLRDGFAWLGAAATRVRAALAEPSLSRVDNYCVSC